MTNVVDDKKDETRNVMQTMKINLGGDDRHVDLDGCLHTNAQPEYNNVARWCVFRSFVFLAWMDEKQKIFRASYFANPSNILIGRSLVE
jgi:hypothetical protein